MGPHIHTRLHPSLMNRGGMHICYFFQISATDLRGSGRRRGGCGRARCRNAFNRYAWPRCCCHRRSVLETTPNEVEFHQTCWHLHVHAVDVQVVPTIAARVICSQVHLPGRIWLSTNEPSGNGNVVSTSRIVVYVNVCIRRAAVIRPRVCCGALIDVHLVHIGNALNTCNAQR